MIGIGHFFFKYRNLIFPVFGMLIFMPSPPLFSPRVFGPEYYTFPLVVGLTISISGQLVRALTIGLKYIVRGGKNKEVYAEDLVTDGLFHHCRNPLYIGNILMLLGVGILANSLYFLILVVPVFMFIYQSIVLAEESFLKSKFGEQYEFYTLAVNRWIPKLTGLNKTIASMEFNWKRYIVSEYNTVYLLLLSILIILTTHHPEISRLSLNEKLKVDLVSFTALSVAYLVVRYMKKSKRLKNREA